MQISVSQILSKTAEITGSRLGGLIGMWLTFFAMQIIFMMIAFGAFGTSLAALGLAAEPQDMGAMGMGMGIGMMFMMFLLYLVYFYLYAAQSAAMSRLASPLLNPNFGEALTGGFISGISLMGAFVLLAIGYFIGAIVLGLVAGVLSLLGPVGAVISAVALIAALLYLAARLSILAPVVAVDGVRNPVTAIARAWQLTGANVVNILLALLVLIAGSLVLFAIPFALFYGTIESLGEGAVDPASAIGSMFGMFGLFALVGVIVTVVASVMIAVIHAGVSGTQAEHLERTFE
ncbi:MAG: hypothetical protein APF78_11630 [Sphingomonadales bacterium BRH_c3]|nr:MAG: hypothetical protein APF78_11630 [Sphingomonadales bacterium BRH_c3]